MVTGDPAEAATFGIQVLEWAGALRSGRAIDDLRGLRRLAEPHASLTDVADLHGRIGTVVAA
jgi:hypothetical protein